MSALPTAGGVLPTAAEVRAAVDRLARPGVDVWSLVCRATGLDPLRPAYGPGELEAVADALVAAGGTFVVGGTALRIRLATARAVAARVRSTT